MPLFTHADGARLTLDGAQLYHEAQGPADAPVLLMLHGGLGSLTDLNPIAARLDNPWRLIGIDLRMHGRSTHGDAPLTYARHEADVCAVLDALGVARCAVFGFSDGGITAYRLAAQAPDRVTQLVTLGAQWRLRAEDAVFGMLRSMTPARWRQIDAEAVADYERLNPAPDVDALVSAAVESWTDLAVTGYPGESVRHIHAPTLVARGDHDRLLSLTEATALCSALPNASLLNIPWSDHAAHHTAAEVLSAALNLFLSNEGR